MRRNVGTTDRWLRIGLGLALLLFVAPRTAWGYIGIVPLLTGIFEYCPLYQLMNWSSREPAPGR
jgi:hypothetical protein